MKRILLFMMIFLTLMTSYAFGNASLPQQRMIMDGRSTNFYVVQLALNGQAVKSDVPPVIYNDRTLVPVAIISQHIGAEVKWNPETYQVTITKEDREIVLTIDSATATVNGERKQLPDNVPAKIITHQDRGRTFVPIGFISGMLGLDVKWDNHTRTVIINEPEKTEEKEVTEEVKEEVKENGNAVAITDFNVATKNGVPEVRIKTGEKVLHDELRLVNPDRLVIDFKNTKLALEDRSKLNADNMIRMNGNNTVFNEVRASQFEVNPHTTRVVMELKKATNHQIIYDQDTGEMVIRFINQVNHVRIDKMNMKEVIVIEGGSVDDYNVMLLHDPERLVVDIKGSVIDPNIKIPTGKVDGKVISGIRVAQFKPDHHYQADDQIVRTVIDLKEKKEIDDFYFEVRENQLIVHVEGEAYENMIYEQTGLIASTLVLRGNRETDYRVTKNQGSDRLNVTVSKADFNQEFTNVVIQDHMVKEIFMFENASDQYEFEIVLQEGVEYVVMTNNPSKNLVIVLRNDNMQHARPLIIIDAGHGGTDPGATSPNLKIKEKDVVLDVAQRLNKLLMDAGFRTYMIRDNDTFVGLYDRAEIANQLQADLYISVHANAAANSAVDGTETFYHKGAQTSERETQSRRVAQLFQEEVVKELQSTNRGVKTANFVVLRETTMPAVLHEIGFLTNPNEESKLNTSAYRQKSAAAMYRAIVRYFEGN